MDGDRPITTEPWSETEELRVSVNEFKGRQYFSIRIWFQGDRGKPGQFFPGKSGINVPLEKVETFFKVIVESKRLFDAMVKRGMVTIPGRE